MLDKVPKTAQEAAKIQKALWRVGKKCTKAEENERFLMSLLKGGVSVASDEEFLKSEEGSRRASKLGEKGKCELRKVLLNGKLSDCKKTGGQIKEETGEIKV